MPIKVAITDDHPLAINGLKNMLQDSGHIRVTDTYLGGQALLEGLQQQQPDILLLDIQLPDIPGDELVPIIRKNWPAVRILVVTSMDAPIQIRTMLKKGCKGYLLKSTDMKTLIQAIEDIYNGNEEFIEPSLREQMLQNFFRFRRSGQKVPSLTRREQDILQLITNGLTNQEIATQLYISLRTVEKHRFSLMQKLDAKNTAVLVKNAIALGLIRQ